MKLKSFVWLCAAGVAAIVVAACAPKTEAPAKPAATAPSTSTAAEFRTTATIKDIMDSVVDPSADYLWDSVATIVTRKGTDERRPRTPEDWKNVRRRAIALVEATN